MSRRRGGGRRRGGCPPPLIKRDTVRIQWVYSEEEEEEEEARAMSKRHTFIETSSPKGNDRSPVSKQVFLNRSQVSKRLVQLVKGS